MTNDLVVRQQMNLSFEELARAAKAMAMSGYFGDARKTEQAMVKVLAGSELGIGPFSAMTSIHVIKGKPVMGANLIATLIKNDPRYNYRVDRLDDEGCTISFYEGDEKIGESSFTKADANRAGLGGDNWKKYPRNMYFARAISNGAKWYTPGIFSGATVYTPDELGADVDEEGMIIDVTPEPSPPSNGHKLEPEPETVEAEVVEQQPATSNGDKALSWDGFATNLADFANDYAEQDDYFKNGPHVVSVISKAFDNPGVTFKNRAPQDYIDVLEAHKREKAEAA